MRLTVLVQCWRHRLPPQKKGEGEQGDKLDFGVAALFSDRVNPLGNCFPVPARPRTAENDSDFQHCIFSSLKSFLVFTVCPNSWRLCLPVAARRKIRTSLPCL